MGKLVSRVTMSVSMRRFQQYHLQFGCRVQITVWEFMKEQRVGTKPREKSAREQIARVLVKEDRN